MIKAFKIMLIPNNKQATRLMQSAGAGRFAYNWALSRQRENYEAGGKFIPDNELRKEFTRLKRQDGYGWLNDYSNDITKQAIKDACEAYERFFKGLAAMPRFKKRKETRPSFYVDPYIIQFTDTHVKLSKIALGTKRNRLRQNWIRLSERGRIPAGCKYLNPRVTFDGIHWFISVGIECQDSTEEPVNDGIGIDLGIKELAVCSDIDEPYGNINKSMKMKKLKKKKRRLQRRISRKYAANNVMNTKGVVFRKTNNIIKAEKQLLRTEHRMAAIRHDHLHQITAEIISRKPRFIVLEDLNVRGMMKNRYLSEAVQEQCLYEFYRQIEYKCSWNNIRIITADRFYPSSKICSCCGAIKKDLKLKDRVYKCPDCGMSMDRDKNASINLYNYGCSMT